MFTDFHDKRQHHHQWQPPKWVIDVRSRGARACKYKSDNLEIRTHKQHSVLPICCILFYCKCIYHLELSAFATDYKRKRKRGSAVDVKQSPSGRPKHIYQGSFCLIIKTLMPRMMSNIRSEFLKEVLIDP